MRDQKGVIWFHINSPIEANPEIGATVIYDGFAIAIAVSAVSAR